MSRGHVIDLPEDSQRLSLSASWQAPALTTGSPWEVDVVAFAPRPVGGSSVDLLAEVAARIAAGPGVGSGREPADAIRALGASCHAPVGVSALRKDYSPEGDEALTPGAESRTGKTSWGDLREGKRTVLLSYAATRPEWRSIGPLIGRPDMTAADAASVRSALISCGAKDYAVNLAAENAHLAAMHLNSGGVPDGLRDSLDRVLRSVISNVTAH